MLKKIVLLLMVIANVASATVADDSQNSHPTNWVPFPWAKELPFTWSTAQGVWTVGTGAGSVTSYFYIRVTQDKFNKSVRFLSITEKEAATCSTVATGFGTEENNKRIIADMKYVDSTRPRYRMMLRIYDTAEVPDGHDVQPVAGKVMVLTITPKSSTKTYNYPMVKISDRTEFTCKPIK